MLAVEHNQNKHRFLQEVYVSLYVDFLDFLMRLLKRGEMMEINEMNIRGCMEIDR